MPEGAGAPKETPVLRHKLGREHLSVISGITEQGRLYIQVRDKSFKVNEGIEFLQYLLKHVPGKLLVIWNGSPIHRSEAVKNFLAEGGSKRIQLERLPACSPDLNPDEGVWQYLKCVCLKNICCRDPSHLKRELKKGDSYPSFAKACHLWMLQQNGICLVINADISK